ncbi:MAG: ribonuclease E/G [Emcibacter sp.]|nr:ribonuclease E/G [Emcibacter sp.]
MTTRMLIDASHEEETRVAIVHGTRVEEFDYESSTKKQIKGNIYLAKITRVEPSLQAAFVEYGGNRHGFLAFSEIHPDYYQIPIADREELIAEEAAAYAKLLKEEEEEEIPEKKPKRKPRKRTSSRKDNKKTEDNKESGSSTEAENTSGDASETVSDKTTDTEEKADTISEATDVPNDAPATAEQSEDVTVTKDVAEVDKTTDPATEVSEKSIPESEQTTEAVSEESSDKPSITKAEVVFGPETITEEVTSDDTAEDDVSEDDESEESNEAENDTESAGSDVFDDEEAEERLRIKIAKGLRRRYKIQEVIKKNQVVLIQVVKEERGNKGAALTTYLSLPGRYCVLMPNTLHSGGVSRKIANVSERKSLKKILSDLEMPSGIACIIRTAGQSRTKTEIKRDFDYLIRTWEGIRERTLKSVAPVMINEEGDLIKRSIRDLYTREIDEILVEGEEGYKIARNFMRLLMPSHAKKIHHYTEPTPLLHKFQVESQLDSMFSPTVQLRSGGYMLLIRPKLWSPLM